jgi:hypothetical protein
MTRNLQHSPQRHYSRRAEREARQRPRRRPRWRSPIGEPGQIDRTPTITVRCTHCGTPSIFARVSLADGANLTRCDHCARAFIFRVPA